MDRADPVERYLELGLRLGRHVNGLVDAYYGPAELRRRVDAEPISPPDRLARDARQLVADLDAGEGDLDARRRKWLRGQSLGLHTTSRRLAGESLGFVEEVEASYGTHPTRVDEDEIEGAQRELDSVLPGSGPLRERYIAWREAQLVPKESLSAALHSLADDFRERTREQFGLPEGESMEFELVENEPWSGFNYYLGDLRSRVAINTDLPVLSPGLGHLVAHEAYPGHHTEHSRKEAGLVRVRGHLEQTIAMIGTPSCLLAEGLADLALEVIAGTDAADVVAGHLRPLGIPFDADIVRVLGTAGELVSNAVRGNVAFLLHDDGVDQDTAVAYVERWGLLPRNRAAKVVEFQTDPVWRSYIFCYIDGLRLCRSYVDGDPTRFERLISEQLVPEDLATAA